MFRQISSRIQLPRNSRDLLHAANLRHGTDGFTSPPKEGVLRIFSPLKIWRLRPGLNPRAWVPKASTLPLDHRSRCNICNWKTKSLNKTTFPIESFVGINMQKWAFLRSRYNVVLRLGFMLQVSNPGGQNVFSIHLTPSHWPWLSLSLLYSWYRVFWADEAGEEWRWPPSSTEVEHA